MKALKVKLSDGIDLTKEESLILNPFAPKDLFGYDDATRINSKFAKLTNFH